MSDILLDEIQRQIIEVLYGKRDGAYTVNMGKVNKLAKLISSQYDDIKEMQKEIQAILEKYQDKRTTKGMYNLDRPHTKKGKEIQEKLNDLQSSDSEATTKVNSKAH